MVTLLPSAPAATDDGVVYSASHQDITTRDDVMTAALHQQPAMVTDEDTVVDADAIKPVPSTYKRCTLRQRVHVCYNEESCDKKENDTLRSL